MPLHFFEPWDSALRMEVKTNVPDARGCEAPRLMPAVLSMVCLVGFMGCSSDGEEGQEDAHPAPDDSPAIVHGFAVRGHEVRSFRPCGSSEDLWAVDTSGVLWTLHQELAPSGPPYPELYTILEGRRGPTPADGFGADYPGTMVISRVLHVAAEGDRCGSEPAAVRVWAGGNEPFWSLSIQGDSLRLDRLGFPTAIWRGVAGSMAEGQVWIGAEANARQSDVPSLQILPRPCRDSMAGSFFHASVNLFLNTVTLSGCAWMPGQTEGSPLGPGDNR
jgi:putative lipoprotein